MSSRLTIPSTVLRCAQCDAALCMHAVTAIELMVDRQKKAARQKPGRLNANHKDGREADSSLAYRGAEHTPDLVVVRVGTLERAASWGHKANARGPGDKPCAIFDPAIRRCDCGLDDFRAAVARKEE